MTEASENAYVVRVRAQVMCRDEATGGWVALGGGGLAHVCVGRRPHPTLHARNGDSNGDSGPLHEYYIHGRRISDNMVVLECTIKKDFQYNKVMPTFHHWVTDEKRFGLTFQTAADARAFDKGVRIAVQELLHGLDGASPSLNAYNKMYSAPNEEDDEQNIFECLNLPCSSLSSSSSSSSRPRAAQTPILCAITLPTRDEPIKQYDVHYVDKHVEVSEPCSYVHLTAVHEYTYPAVGPGRVAVTERSSPNTKPGREAVSVHHQFSVSVLPDKKPNTQQRQKCKYCSLWYSPSTNRPGSCDSSRDSFRNCIDCVTCIKCAQCMLYHCSSEEDGECSQRPCQCSPLSDSCAKRWVGVALLSALVPCMCCYLPLRAAHRAARAAGLAGPRHVPV